ncbi:MFS general substrate transporter [Coniochaeta ligniaria NRRL 30616]|uniref:MFS general substrate transporter n=1 Tax=Coniochaeta ligniaria NRRL 30616 TaxID=1408157 RepID=A0A1J7JIG3_9PEZI|nr:MFS general substrate transporter [Coniochaeta ligniaria NRRL 30616]
MSGAHVPEAIPVDDERTPLLGPPGTSKVSDSTLQATSVREEGNTIQDYGVSDELHISISSVAEVLHLVENAFAKTDTSGVFVANAEGSLVLASYAQISSEFDDLNNSNWIVTSYMLATSVTMPMYGKLSDIFGRSHMIMVAYVMFVIGNLVCGIAQSLAAVVVGRTIAGIGGAGMGTLVSIIITDLVPRRDVAMWRSYVGIIAVAGRSSGGVIGGYLSDTVGWRLYGFHLMELPFVQCRFTLNTANIFNRTFLGQCPPTALALLLSWYLVPNTTVASSNQSTRQKLGRVDFVGGLLIGLTILAFLLTLELAGTTLPWDQPGVYCCFAASAAFGLLTCVYESACAKEPILSPRLLLSRDILIPNTTNFCQAAAQLGMMYTVPIFFQATQGASSSTAGAHLLPAPLGVTVGGLIGGCMTRRSGHYRVLLVVATVCSSVSYLLLALRWGEHVSTWQSLYMFPSGLGNGLVLSTVFVALTANVEGTDMSAVCSIYYMTGQIGALVGIAVTDAVLQGTLWSRLQSELNTFPDKIKIIQGVFSDIDYIQGLEGHAKQIVVLSYIQAMKLAHGMDKPGMKQLMTRLTKMVAQNFAFGVIAWLASLLVREYKIRE